VVLDHFDATADLKRERKICDHLVGLASVKHGGPIIDALNADIRGIDRHHPKNKLGR
jgi:hypothetical protein